MALSDLEALWNCKANPSARHSDADWEEVERAIGSAYPADYRELIDGYGPIFLDDFLWVYSPFCEKDDLNILWRTQDLADSMRQSRLEFGREFPVKEFPEVGGLLYWGSTSNGDMVAWKLEPELKTIVVHDCKLLDFRWYDMSMTDWLFAVLSRRSVVPFFPGNFPRRRHTCFCWDKQAYVG